MYAFNAKQLARMVWVARKSDTNEHYDSCSADPLNGRDALQQIAQWKSDGAIVELITKEQAQRVMSAQSVNEQTRLSALFNQLNIEKISDGYRTTNGD